MSLLELKKPELVKLVQELREKLKEMKPVEAQLEARAETLPSHALGLTKDKDSGQYSLVHVKYDVNTGAAAVEKLENIGGDIAIATYNFNKFSSEKIIRKAQGGKYNE